MEEQKAQKSFGLRDSRDMVAKLKWEIGNLFQRQRHDVAAVQYIAFNGAVTAWHAIDWLWLDMTPDRRAERGVSNLLDLQNLAREQCPALRLCYQVATGSKHCLMTRNPDPNITAQVTDGDGYDYGNPVIRDGDQEHAADRVFWEAIFWIEDFQRRHDLFPEEPFVPLGDEPVGLDV